MTGLTRTHDDVAFRRDSLRSTQPAGRILNDIFYDQEAPEAGKKVSWKDAARRAMLQKVMLQKANESEERISQRSLEVAMALEQLPTAEDTNSAISTVQSQLEVQQRQLEVVMATLSSTKPAKKSPKAHRSRSAKKINEFTNGVIQNKVFAKSPRTWDLAPLAATFDVWGGSAPPPSSNC
ncbi:hypothetical protein CYMTET_34480 [Cymbomonas tetramitiformis]|uniref:Uncharacterized protein n=1 Tax=Cymbomonas tetramitiformis TaxID=36881 RepID=A0AAE0KQ63_9CHLO|nr:hypothetical protein CYMTET_34480 [Cymbomonas tetramitiformis]